MKSENLFSIIKTDYNTYYLAYLKFRSSQFFNLKGFVSIIENERIEKNKPSCKYKKLSTLIIPDALKTYDKPIFTPNEINLNTYENSYPEFTYKFYLSYICDDDIIFDKIDNNEYTYDNQPSIPIEYENTSSFTSISKETSITINIKYHYKEYDDIYKKIYCLDKKYVYDYLHKEYLHKIKLILTFNDQIDSLLKSKLNYKYLKILNNKLSYMIVNIGIKNDQVDGLFKLLKYNYLKIVTNKLSYLLTTLNEVEDLINHSTSFKKFSYKYLKLTTLIHLSDI